ncbi:MAG: type I methionyl aminopeptidase [Armatimonadota bacterium]|nr:type I methionyl aminopeptidase [Armatimonadota bacterium]MDR7464130.1 type I methionyl aminopeptidase [Armatimonadota bacterium]MDR7470421.1 type I methionyl aminopeptidase [Armatimonadota bacterium]MDR7473503.1 type I methionyl aminopeptidase [Armatimonadota bacterium]MDR7540140.1 type I methionyl aminopeptidase [Armatimonadota bacterium]
MVVVKTAEEIARMRRACRLAARALQLVLQAVAPDVSTGHLDRLAETFIRDHGGVPSFKHYRGYPASICVSVDEEVVHGIPGRRRLRQGSIVSIDLGVYLDGFHGDVARTVPVGDVDEETYRLLRVAEEALAAGIREAREGRTTGDVGWAIQQVAEGAGFSVVRDFAGHGIGRELHEGPEVPNFGTPGAGVPLRRGLTLAIEPMVNAGGSEVVVLEDGWTVRTRDRLRSAHFEHTVAVDVNGAEVLTSLD